MMLLVIISLHFQFVWSISYNNSLRIGCLLDSHDSVLSSSVQQTVASINNSSRLLPSTRLDLHTVFTDSRDMLTVYQGICSQLEHSIVTLVTSQGPPTGSNHVQSGLITEMLNKWHIPHFSTQIVSTLQMER